MNRQKCIMLRMQVKYFIQVYYDTLEAPNAAFYLGQTCLYDSLHLNYAELTTVEKDLVSAIPISVIRRFPFWRIP